MSVIALCQEGLIVADDVLENQAFVALRDYIARSDYHCVHGQKWNKVWRLWDGNPQRGQSVYYDPDQRFVVKGTVYPTGTAMDHLIDVVRTFSALNQEVAGTECIDWFGMYLCPWLYPVGSALSMHLDSGKYSGSFTFFVHSRWNSHWGGELLVSPPLDSFWRGASNSPALGQDPPWISDDGIDEAMSSDIAVAIAPKPNRLVLIGENRPHRVARVDQNAGAHVRVSIAGFFLRAL
jgi:2OG-Fe(II) oxygenase superfamily